MLVLKNQVPEHWGLVFLTQLSIPLDCYFCSNPFYVFSKLGCSAIKTNAESGPSHCLYHISSLHHHNDHSFNCCCPTISILPSTHSRSHSWHLGSWLSSVHILLKTTLTQEPSNWNPTSLPSCLPCSGYTKLPIGMTDQASTPPPLPPGASKIPVSSSQNIQHTHVALSPSSNSFLRFIFSVWGSFWTVHLKFQSPTSAPSPCHLMYLFNTLFILLALTSQMASGTGL